MKKHSANQSFVGRVKNVDVICLTASKNSEKTAAKTVKSVIDSLPRQL